MFLTEEMPTLVPRTRLCKFFAIGACAKGSACTFAHGMGHLREQPDFSKTRPEFKLPGINGVIMQL